MSQLSIIAMRHTASVGMDANWKESDHPRKHGQFAKKGAGTTGEKSVAGSSERRRNFYDAAKRSLNTFSKKNFETVLAEIEKSGGELSYRDAVAKLRKLESKGARR